MFTFITRLLNKTVLFDHEHVLEHVRPGDVLTVYSSGVRELVQDLGDIPQVELVHSSIFKFRS